MGQKYISRIDKNGYALNKLGRTYSIELVRRHRIWEAYLVNKMDYKPDHVHEEAELVEHLLDPQMAEKIQSELNITEDPHGNKIPDEQTLEALRDE